MAGRNLSKGWPTNYGIRRQRRVAADLGQNERKGRLTGGESNCFDDCDYPGQCSDVRFEARLIKLLSEYRSEPDEMVIDAEDVKDGEYGDDEEEGEEVVEVVVEQEEEQEEEHDEGQDEEEEQDEGQDEQEEGEEEEEEFEDVQIMNTDK